MFLGLSYYKMRKVIGNKKDYDKKKEARENYDTKYKEYI